MSPGRSVFRAVLSTLVLGLSGPLTGCSEEVTPAPADLGTKVEDGGLPELDAGPVDAGEPDAGPTEVDAGPVDAGPVDAGAPDAGWGPPVACGAALPGIAMQTGLVEGQPNYAQELAALDLSTLPASWSTQAEAKFQAGVINWMLGRDRGTTITRADAEAAGPLGQAVLGAMAKGSGGKVDFTFLRRGLQHFYPCGRPVPASLNELTARYGDWTQWPGFDLVCARPKNGPRRFYENELLGVFIAETVENGIVRETEVLFDSLRTDGQLDFAVYTPQGELTDRSTFATRGGTPITSASPYTCLSCHVDAVTGRMKVRKPTGTGAGCAGQP